jgi:hypothetical protein
LFLNKLPANTRETFKWKSKRKKNTGYSIWRYSLIHTFKWLKPTTEDVTQGLLWSWSYGSWIYNYLCNQCLYHWNCEFEPCSWRSVLDTMLCDKVCQWLATGRWFTPVSSTNKSDHHDTAEILLKVALNTI